MGDPVTMAVVGGTIGAVAYPDDPLKGALIGAAGGYGGTAALTCGMGSIGSSLTGATSAAGTGGGFLNGGYGSVGLSGQTALGGSGAAGGGSTGFLGNTMAGLGKDFGAISQYAQNNPNLSNMAMGAGMNALQPAQPLPSGGMKQGSIEYPQLGMGMPQQPFMPQRKISLI